MKELPISERPYEKLEMYGSNSLSNAELLAIIIKTGTREESSVTIAQKILKLNKEKRITFIISSHYLDELSKIATCYGFINEHKIVKEIDRDELEKKFRKRRKMVFQ